MAKPGEEVSVKEQQIRFCITTDGFRIAYSSLGQGLPVIVPHAWVSHQEASNQMVEEIYKKNKDAQLLFTIPGIGKTLSVLISTEIDGIGRFSSPSRLCSYAGLVPSTHSSGGKTYHGKITLEGNRWLRWALLEAVVPASYADIEVRTRLNTLRKIKSANVAKAIMARWLLKVVYHVLKENRSYVPADPAFANPGRLVKALASSE